MMFRILLPAAVLCFIDLVPLAHVAATERSVAFVGDSKDGKLEERDADGKLVLSGMLLKGKLDGEATYYENDKPVRKLTFEMGVVKHSRSLEEIRKTLEELAAPTKDENEAALRTLKAYRYLVGVPYDDLELDENYTKLAQSATKLCKELGRLEHRPKNPGWPEEEFAVAFKGTSSSSLAQGFPTLPAAVVAWMDDSDKFNIDRLGHRRWCINPTMRKTGFGRTSDFTAMYTFDMGRSKAPAYDYVAYPPPGPVPAKFFGPRYAWSISFHPGKYRVPEKGVEVNVYPLDSMGRKKDALKLDHFNVDFIPFGIPNCVIFRPAPFDMALGRLYLVEIEGVQAKKGASTIRYVVELAGK